MTKEQLGDIFELTCTPRYEVFYNEDSLYGIYEIMADKALPYSSPTYISDNIFSPTEDDVRTQMFVTTLVGNTQRLVIDQEYEIKAKLSYSEKYKSYNYTIISVSSSVPKTKDEQKKFLLAILTSNQAEALINAYPNIVNDVMDGNADIDFSKVKGIAQHTWDKIKKKIIENYVLADILSLLSPHGITINKIQKLLEKETNPMVLKEKILNNPYVLSDIPGIGFRIADKIAIGLKPELRTSVERLSAFITDFLRKEGNDEGHTWANIKSLRDATDDTVPECTELFKDLLKEQKENSTFLHVEKNKVGVKFYRDVEMEIMDVINGLNNSDPIHIPEEEILQGIADAEKEQGFEFTEEQREGLIKITKSNFNIITGKAGCVDKDTEFFNGEMWKKMSDYNGDDKVLQYSKDGSAQLVYPEDYIKEECDYLWHFKTKYGLDQCLSDEHNVYYITSKGNLYNKKMRDVVKNHNDTGFSGRFITSFSYDGSGFQYNDVIIRLLVAAIADGSYYYHVTKNAKSYNRCRFHIKKEKKKKRLMMLFKESGLEWRKVKSATDGYHDLYIDLPERTKEFDVRWYSCTQRQLKIVCDELQYWDANVNITKNGVKRLKLFTTIKNNADFIQFAYSSCDFRASMSIQDRRGRVRNLNGKNYITKSIDYNINVTKGSPIGLTIDKRKTHTKTKINKYKSLDGYKYCFTVPSGMLILRRNNKIFITGNSGKSTLLRGAFHIYKKRYSTATCALSAKASKRIEETTGQPSATIHRLLGARSLTKFNYDKDHRLPHDIIILDEASMVNAGIMRRLLIAVKDGAKVIFCGDAKQLPPIGYGNVFSDLIEKEYLQINYLTKILRQAEASGIISDANKIRNGINPIEEITFKVVHGELADMHYRFREERSSLNKIAIEAYLKSVEEVGIDDVFLLVPRKNTVINSTLKINEIIQDKLLDKNLPSIKHFNKEYRLGCKVIHRKNNYQKNIFNGEMGYVSSILSDGLEVDYGNKTITYTKSELKELDYAYALTTHLYQGSEAHTIIGIIDNTHYMLLDTTFLYTTITRASKRMLLLAEPEAFRRCLKNNKSINRNTWIKEME